VFNDGDLNAAFQKMFASFEEYIREGSNWVLKQIIKLEVSTVNYSPLGGSTYIPTLTTFSHHPITNILNKDEKCLLWSVLAFLHLKSTNLKNKTIFQLTYLVMRAKTYFRCMSQK